MTCNHSYAFPLAKEQGLMKCTMCGAVFQRHAADPAPADFKLPFVHYGLTPETWEKLRPWKLMDFSIPKKYGWYISVMGPFGDDYLIMPIMRGNKPVFYSARRLTERGGLKYMTPEFRRRLWVSRKAKRGEPVAVISEGVADAAYTSQLWYSIATLSNYWNEELIDLTKTVKRVIIMYDPDPRGITGAVGLAKEMSKYKPTVWIALPEGDPTEYPLDELKKFVEG